MDFGSLIPVVAIIASVAFGAMVIRFYEIRSQNGRLEHDSRRQAVEKLQLEQRLAVLERIVTDRGLQTAEQIGALRDRPAAGNNEKMSQDQGSGATHGSR